MGTVSLHGVCDMHVHTNPDLRLRAYDDFELADAAVRVGAKAIVIKSHLGFTVNRAYLTNQYVKRVYGENTGFTMYGGVVMNKVVGGINPEAVEKGLKLGAKEIWLPTQSAKRHLEKMGQDPEKGIELVRDGKVVPKLLDVFRLIKDYNVVLGNSACFTGRSLCGNRGGKRCRSEENRGYTSGVVGCGHEHGRPDPSGKGLRCNSGTLLCTEYGRRQI